MEDIQHKYSDTSVASKHALHDSEETAKMLRIAIAQIETTMEEADDSIAKLVDSIMGISNSILKIENELESMGKEQVSESASSSIRRHCESVANNAGSVVRALQFYDRLTQRFSHVHDCLDGLARLIQMNEHNDITWEKLQEKVRSVYSLKQEQEIFKAFNDREIREPSTSETTGKKKCDAHGEIDIF